MATGDTEVRPVLALLGSPDVPPPTDLAALEAIADIRHTTADELGSALPGADVLVVWDFFSRALRDNWAQADALRWVHVCAAGVDSLLFDELTDSDVVVTNAHGVFDRPIAEFVLASILARDKLLHESMRLQARREWRWRETRSTTGTSALVIGTGGIGREIARLLRAVGIEVTGAGRRARDHDPDFGVVHETAQLAEYVGGFDTVVAIAPLTAATRAMIDAEVLAAMRADAHLINVGRGDLVDEPALIEALQTGEIGAASLDVFVTEPLPADNPLWGMDNVAISAHLSGDVVGWREVLSAQILDNLRRYVGAGDDDLETHLDNVVDKVRGYVVRRDPHTP
ncbi:D-2-hydroxyacid dehydrogenase [Gordonia polyisoprenivorans]|uniref:D-2-hydroxyacid dehydrogenase n=1 Tax=Gordonia polyisoprenivorans TaxID=84595 RepID=UPI002301B840|nr:D-2-hydroxyacid dehydrogenase [Gordonia polyisoprenivorans]WCB36851.1 D-2-hydroxyacid dehydrogenase [Gordonia polyisoprenivorans]